VEATGRPLSVVLVDGAPTSGPGRRELVAALRSRLRASDALGERSDGALALLLPDTGADAATGQAADLGRVLAGVNGGARVGTATAERARSGRDLLREAERDARS
jgi:hypothetical protein